VHLYSVAALALLTEYVFDQISYQQAVIFMMRTQVMALQSIGHSLAGHIL